MILITQVEVKDDIGQRILDGFCKEHGYYSDIVHLESVPADTMTQQEFLQSFLLDIVFKSLVKNESAIAAEDAAKQKEAEIEATVKPELTKIGGK